MDDQDRQAIEGLFARLGEVERHAGPRDAGAEGFIKERITQQPGAPYFMAQTIVMQEYALQDAQWRIEELERQQAERPAGRGLLSGFFGGGQSAGRLAGSIPAVPRGPTPDVGALPPAQPGRGGGFLAGAAQTAMGVAGGVLLGNAIAGMFGGNEANAAETTPASAEKPSAEPPSDEDGGFFDSVYGGDEDV
jgi:hypothetical protein